MTQTSTADRRWRFHIPRQHFSPAAGSVSRRFCRSRFRPSRALIQKHSNHWCISKQNRYSLCPQIPFDACCPEPDNHPRRGSGRTQRFHLIFRRSADSRLHRFGIGQQFWQSCRPNHRFHCQRGSSSLQSFPDFRQRFRQLRLCPQWFRCCSSLQLSHNYSQLSRQHRRCPLLCRHHSSFGWFRYFLRRYRKHSRPR